MEEYSKRLGKITPEQFQAALARFGLGDFVRAERVPSGLFGQNVFVTSTQGEFVLRGVPHYDWQFPTERFFVEQLHQKTGVPVPYPYLLEPSADIFGWSFVLMPRLPGISPANKAVTDTLSLTDRRAIARALARTLAQAHTLTWSHAGTYDPETGGVRPLGMAYGAWVAQRVRQKLAQAQEYNDHTTLADAAWVETIIADAGSALKAPDVPCAVLGDYGEHNVVVENVGRALARPTYRVSGVFDLMTAHFGDSCADLCVPVAGYLKVDAALADEFVREYLRHRPAQAGFVARQRLYTLGLHASMWEYWQRAQGGSPEDPGGCFRQWTEVQVAYWKGKNW